MSEIPILSAPPNISTGISRTPTFSWNSQTYDLGYVFQLSRDNTFNDIDIFVEVTEPEFNVPDELDPTTTYHWRVRSIVIPESERAPVPGNNGAVTVSNITDSGFIVSFAKATSVVTDDNLLVYKLYSAASVEDLTLENIQSQTLEDEGTDVSQLTITNPSSTFIIARVIVEDQAGNIALYDIVEELLENPEVLFVEIDQDDIESFEGDSEEQSGTLTATVTVNDDADDSVNWLSSNPSVATINEETGAWAIVEQQETGIRTTTFTAESNFDSSMKDSITLTLYTFTEENESEPTTFETEI